MKNVYLNLESEVSRYNNYGLIFKHKKNKTSNYEGKLYTYYGKASTLENDSSYIFKARCAYIAEICLAILSLGLLMISKSYRKLLSHHYQDLKNGKELVKIYFLKTDDPYFARDGVHQYVPIPHQAQGGPLVQNGSVVEPLKTIRLPNPGPNANINQVEDFVDTYVKDLILLENYTEEEKRAYQADIEAFANKANQFQDAFDNLSFRDKKRIIFGILNETRSLATDEAQKKIETLFTLLSEFPKDGVLSKEVLDLGKDILANTRPHFDQYIYILNAKNQHQHQALKFLPMARNLLQDIVALNKQEEFIKKADMNLIKNTLSEALVGANNWDTQLDNFPKIKYELIKQNKWDEISSYLSGSLLEAANLRMRDNPDTPWRTS